MKRSKICGKGAARTGEASRHPAVLALLPPYQRIFSGSRMSRTGSCGKTHARPSLHFKKIDRFCSVRVGLRYRALALEHDDNVVWFWIGPHSEYDQVIGRE